MKKLGIDIIKVICSSVWLRRDRFRKGGLKKLGIDIIKKLGIDGANPRVTMS